MTDINEMSSALVEADDLFKRDKVQESLAIYTKLLDKNQEDIELLLRRSKCYYNLKDYKLAFNDAKSAYDIDSTHIQACVWCGRAATKLKQFEKAFRFYKDGLKVDAKSSLITEDLQKLQRAILAEHDKVGQDEPTYNAVKFCSQDPYPGDKELYELEQEILDKKYKIANLKQVSQVANVRPEEAAKHAAMAIRYRAGT